MAATGSSGQETRNHQQQDTLATGCVSRSSEAASRSFEAARSDFAFNCQSAPAAPNFSGPQGNRSSQPGRFPVFPSLRALTTFIATRRAGIKFVKSSGRVTPHSARTFFGLFSFHPSEPYSHIERNIMLGTILLIILILMLLGALPTWPHSRSWGYYPSGGLGLLLIILVILLLLGRI
jgi:hypothetical protein